MVIDGRQGEFASVRLGPLLLSLPHHGAVEGAAELSIRPQALLLAPGAGSADALAGRVSKAAYLGSHMEYWVVVDGMSKELFVIAHDVEAPFAVGDALSPSPSVASHWSRNAEWIRSGGFCKQATGHC